MDDKMAGLGGLSTRPSPSSAVFVGEIREGIPWAGNSTAD